jgi:hypothetical protein
MAYARSSTEHELVTLRDEITKEVNADASHIAKSVFGEVADMPDTARISDERLDEIYRRAYARGDRQWLLSEAQRDPLQFIKVARRIGVQPASATRAALRASATPPAAATPLAPPAPSMPALPPAPLAPPMPMPQTAGGGGIGSPGSLQSPITPPAPPPLVS